MENRDNCYKNEELFLIKVTEPDKKLKTLRVGQSQVICWVIRVTEHIARVISMYGAPDIPVILYNVCVPCQSRGRRHRSRPNVSDRPHELTLEQKLYVVQREVTETQQDREKLKQKYQRIQDNYKVTRHPSTEIKIQ